MSEPTPTYDPADERESRNTEPSTPGSNNSGRGGNEGWTGPIRESDSPIFRSPTESILGHQPLRDIDGGPPDIDDDPE
jgi:hypothetical protein